MINDFVISVPKQSIDNPDSIKKYMEQFTKEKRSYVYESIESYNKRKAKEQDTLTKLMNSK